MHYVYLLIDPFTNQPFYVGKGVGKRKYHHVQPSQQKYNPIKANKIKSIIERGGDIQYETIECATESDAFKLEVELITKYGKLCNGTGILTNLDDGGRGGSSGRPITEEVRKKLKLRKRVSHSEKTRQLIANAHKRTKTKEIKLKIQQSTNNSCPVLQYTVKGKLVNEYISARQAYIETGIDASQIIYCCKGKRGYKTAKGFVWKYKNPNDNSASKKKPVIQLDKDLNPLCTYDSIGDAARAFDTSRTMICKCCANPDSTAFGFYWRYL